MSNWVKGFVVFDSIFMTVNHYSDNTNGILFFGFLLIATILVGKE